MAVQFFKGSAPYRFQAETTWCTGSVSGKLSSRGFGSCVGLVLYCPSTTVGMVAHFSGSLGEANHQATATADAKQILLAMRPGNLADWDVWVFGGTSLAKTSTSTSNIDALDLKTGTVEQTTKLIDIVRDEVDKDANFTFTYRTPDKTEGYPGHSAVALDLATGAVTFS